MKNDWGQTGYRVFFDRLIFILALLGILTTVHLWIQQNRGFDRGCLGISISGAIEESFDCGSVLMSDAGKFMGFSNTILGHLFYVALVFVCLSIVILPFKFTLHLKLLRFLMILGGLGYTGWLVYYQYFVLYEFCALCLISASIVTTIFIIHIVTLFVKPQRIVNLTESSRKNRELYLMIALILGSVIIAGADVLHFRSLEIIPDKEHQITEIPNSTDTPDEEVPITDQLTAADSLIEPPAPKKPVSSEKPKAACDYHAELEPVDDFRALISSSDPYHGSAGSEVVVFDYFDPNCKHCKTLHHNMKKVMDIYGNYVQFYYKPFPLWIHSIDQIQALYAAAQSNKFFEMLDRQFEIQNPGKGLTHDELKSIADEIGMDGDQLIIDLKNKKYKKWVMAQRSRARKIGIRSAPVVMVNGKFIASKSRTVECISEFIEVELNR